jgi:hypothetical protein
VLVGINGDVLVTIEPEVALSLFPAIIVPRIAGIDDLHRALKRKPVRGLKKQMNMGIHEFVVEESEAVFLFDPSKQIQIEGKIFVGFKTMGAVITTDYDMIMKIALLNSERTSHGA